MPVVVELLLVDEEREAGAPEAHLPLAKGVFSDLQRQLQDAQSHLRRKSVFGNLVSRGATVVHVADEQLPVTKLEAPAPTVHLATEAQSELPDVSKSAFASDETAHVAEPEDTNPEASFRGTASDARADLPASDTHGSECAVQVPPINRFPKTPTSKKSATAAIDSWWPVLFDWWPSTCTPAPCKALTGGSTSGCKISVGDPVMDQCLALPSRASNEGSLADHEAGLGGWPLSLPTTFAAFPTTIDSIESAFAPANALSVSASALASAALRRAASAPFRKAAVEVDDEELTVILAPQKGNKSGGGSSRTPSTASTMAPPSPQVSNAVPSVVAYSRLVIPLAGLKVVKMWSKTDVLCCWPNGVGDDSGIQSNSIRDATSLRTCEPGVPWSDVIEVVGLPRGAEKELMSILALPNTAIAKRLQDALQRRPRKHPASSTESMKGFVGAVRCELHIPVEILLGPGPEEVNFAAVVRRGICEACHVSGDRVRVCSMRNGTSFEKPPSPQKGYPQPQPSESGAQVPSQASELPSSVASQENHNAVEPGYPPQPQPSESSGSALRVPSGSNLPTLVASQESHNVESGEIAASAEQAMQPEQATQQQQEAEGQTPGAPEATQGSEICVSGDRHDDVPVDSQKAPPEPQSNEAEEDDSLPVEAATGETPLRSGIAEPLIDAADRREERVKSPDS